MKNGEFITKKEIDEQGWRFVTYFNNYHIYGKENKRMLWSSKTLKVVIYYEKGEQNERSIKTQ